MSNPVLATQSAPLFGGEGGVRRATPGKPTSVPGSLPSFRGKPNTPGEAVKTPAIRTSFNRQNRGSNVTIPYSRVVPLHHLQDIGRVSPGDVCFHSTCRVNLNYGGLSASDRAAGRTDTDRIATQMRILGTDAFNRMLGGRPEYDGGAHTHEWAVGHNVILSSPVVPIPKINADAVPLDPIRDNVADEWRSLPILREWACDGVVLSNDTPGCHNSHGERDGQLFNIAVQGIATLNNGYVDFKGGGVESEHRGHDATKYGYNDGGEPPIHNSFGSAFGQPYHGSYSLQMFDRKIRPGDTTYVGLIATKRVMTTFNRKTLINQTPALKQKYNVERDQPGSDEAKALNASIPDDVESFYTFHFGCFSTQQAWLAAATSQANKLMADDIHATSNHGFAEPSAKKAKKHHEQAKAGETYDPFIGLSPREFQGMVGAWKIGRCVDNAASKRDRYTNGPVDTATAITVDVAVEWCDWRALRRTFQRPDICMRVSGATPWATAKQLWDANGVMLIGGNAVPVAALELLDHGEAALRNPAATDDQVKAFVEQYTRESFPDAAQRRTAAKRVWIAASNRDDLRVMQWPTSYRALTDNERAAMVAESNAPNVVDRDAALEEAYSIFDSTFAPDAERAKWLKLDTLNPAKTLQVLAARKLFESTPLDMRTIESMKELLEANQGEGRQLIGTNAYVRDGMGGDAANRMLAGHEGDASFEALTKEGVLDLGGLRIPDAMQFNWMWKRLMTAKLWRVQTRNTEGFRQRVLSARRKVLKMVLATPEYQAAVDRVIAKFGTDLPAAGATLQQYYEWVRDLATDDSREYQRVLRHGFKFRGVVPPEMTAFGAAEILKILRLLNNDKETTFQKVILQQWHAMNFMGTYDTIVTKEEFVAYFKPPESLDDRLQEAVTEDKKTIRPSITPAETTPAVRPTNDGEVGRFTEAISSAADALNDDGRDLLSLVFDNFDPGADVDMDVDMDVGGTVAEAVMSPTARVAPVAPRMAAPSSGAASSSAAPPKPVSRPPAPPPPKPVAPPKPAPPATKPAAHSTTPVPKAPPPQMTGVGSATAQPPSRRRARDDAATSNAAFDSIFGGGASSSNAAPSAPPVAAVADPAPSPSAASEGSDGGGAPRGGRVRRARDGR